MKNDEPKEKEELKTTFQLELITKVIDNANAVSGAVRLIGENVEEMSQSNERMEKKFDALESKLNKVYEEIQNSKMLSFFLFMHKLFSSIVTKLLTAIIIPFIIFVLLYVLYFAVKGWPLFFKLVTTGGK